jgi:hypothetical protein
MLFNKAVSLEERFPRVRVGFWKISHSIAVLKDVGRQRPAIPIGSYIQVCHGLVVLDPDHPSPIEILIFLLNLTRINSQSSSSFLLII